MLAPCFALGEQAAPWLVDATALRWIGVHYPEQARNQLGATPKQALQQIIEPLWRGFAWSWNAHLPLSLLTDSQLASGALADYQLLLLPARQYLDKAQQQAVLAFEQRGGKVAAITLPQASEKTPAWQSILNETPPPVRVFSAQEKVFHAVFYRVPQGILLALCNDFSWVYTGRTPDAHVHEQPPPPCQDLVIKWDKRLSVLSAHAVLHDQTLDIQSPGQVMVPAFQTLSLILLRLSKTSHEPA